MDLLVNSKYCVAKIRFVLRKWKGNNFMLSMCLLKKYSVFAKLSKTYDVIQIESLLFKTWYLQRAKQSSKIFELNGLLGF